VLYGYSVQECVYTRSSLGIGIESMQAKPIEWFYIRADGKWMYRGSTGLEVECDPRKYFITRRQPSYRQQYGESLLSRLYWTVFFKGHGRKFWAKFLERFGEPLLIGKVADQAKFIADVAALGLAAGLPVQPNETVESVAVTQAGEFERFDNTLAKSIQKAILGQTLTSDVGSSGSFAAAKVHDSVRQDKRNADIRLVTATVQRLIGTLCDLNGWGAPPTFVMADGTGLEMDRAQRDKVLVDAGIVKLSKEYILDRYDFEEGDFEVVAETATPVAESTTDEPESDVAMSASLVTLAKRKQQFTPQQQAIEDAADALMVKVPEPINLDAMLSAVKAATDPTDLAVRLSMLLDQQDPRFTELLARAQFAAQTLGYVVSEQESPRPAVKADPTEVHQHFHMPQGFGVAPSVTLQMEAQPAPTMQVDIHVPEQPAPIVNVASPTVNVSAPIVNIEPAQVTLEATLPVPEITIAMPARKTVTEVERDGKGNIVRANQTEVDA
jgi:phage gp29-like protein